MARQWLVQPEDLCLLKVTRMSVDDSSRGSKGSMKGGNDAITYQLFTCNIVKPVSCANCFFWSSDG